MDIINVTKTFLPPYEEYEKYLRSIWDRAYLTNQGPFLQQFQKEAEQYLGLKNFHFVTNGTIALQLALRALDITEGEVITTPFSYVATTSSILWERCKPVFVDIEPETFCIDADKIEAAITKDTKAIMAVHVFGFPCDVEKIQMIADKYDIKVIYDGAHAFGVEYNGKSLLDYGDVSTCSFHATKVLQTIEGGAVIAKDTAVSEKLELLKRFGHNGDNHIMLGINAKASEFQAAMGLCNLKYVDANIEKRKVLYESYSQHLSAKFMTTKIKENVKHNYAYYPLVIKDEETLLKAVEKLNANNIFPRRYFYPSLNDLPYLVGLPEECPISEKIARTILCLPLYPDLGLDNVKRISTILLKLDEA